MKVLVVAANPGPGGAGVAAKRIYESLQLTCPRGSNVRFLVASTGPDFSQDNSTVVVPPSKLQARLSALMRKTLWKYVGPASTGFFSNGLRDIIIRESPDVINIHWLGDLSLSLREIAGMGIPVVWTLHDLWPVSGIFHYPVESRGGRLGRTLLFFLRPVDKVVAFLKRQRLRDSVCFVSPSSWMANEVSVRWGNEVRNFEIPNPLSLGFWSAVRDPGIKKEFQLSAGQPVVLFAAHSLSDPRKGLEILLRALSVFKKLSDHDSPNSPSEPILILAGGGKIPAVDPTIRVVREPFVSEARLRELYAVATVVVVPSLSENLSQVATQAQSCGVPVIGFSGTGLSSVVVDMETGILVKDRSAEALAQAIHTVISRPSLRDRFGRKARQRARTIWSSQAVGGAYWALFENLCSHPPQEQGP